MKVRTRDHLAERALIAEVRLDPSAIDRPVSVVARISPAVRAGFGMVRVGAGRRHPDGAHPQLVEVAVVDGGANAGEVAPRVIGGLGHVGHSAVVLCVPVSETVGEGEVEQTVCEAERLFFYPERYNE